MRSKTEQTLAYLRAFNKVSAVTERQIYETQLKLFSYKRINELLDKVKDLKIGAEIPSKEWSEFVSSLYRIVKEPTCSRNIHSGNVIQTYKRNDFIQRFKDKDNIWRYYLEDDYIANIHKYEDTESHGFRR